MHTPRTTRSTSRWTLLTALIGVLALVLAACPADDTDEPAVEDDGEPAAEEGVEVDDDLAAQLDATCNNPQLGYDVDHPGDWDVFEDDALAPCSAFHEEEVVFDLNADHPLDTAIQIRGTSGDLDTVTEDLANEDETSRDEVSVDGERAYVIESDATADGVYPEGTQLYSYYIERDGQVIVATANDGIEEDVDFDERRDVLDAMMASLEWGEIEADFEEEGEG